MNIGKVLRKWRKSCDLTLEVASRQMGVSTASLWRLEMDKPTSAETLTAVLIWMIHPSSPPSAPTPTVRSASGSAKRNGK